MLQCVWYNKCYSVSGTINVTVCVWYNKCILDLREEVKEARRQLRQQELRNLYYLLNTVKR